MPAEWEPQKSTWIAWPHNKDDWPGKFDHIPFVFGKIISELSRVQLVNILVKDKSERDKATFFLKFLAEEKVIIKPNTIKNTEIYILKGKSTYGKLSEK